MTEIAIWVLIGALQLPGGQIVVPRPEYYPSAIHCELAKARYQAMIDERVEILDIRCVARAITVEPEGGST